MVDREVNTDARPAYYMVVMFLYVVDLGYSRRDLQYFMDCIYICLLHMLTTQDGGRIGLTEPMRTLDLLLLEMTPPDMSEINV